VALVIGLCEFRASCQGVVPQGAHRESASGSSEPVAWRRAWAAASSSCFPRADAIAKSPVPITCLRRRPRSATSFRVRRTWGWDSAVLWVFIGCQFTLAEYASRKS